MRALRPFFCCLIGIMNVLIVPEAKLYGQAVDGEVGVPDAMAVAEAGRLRTSWTPLRRVF